MKKIVLALVAIFGLTTAVQAEQREAYNEVYVGYNNFRMSPSHGDASNYSGVAFKYLHGFSISETHPMFIEAGGQLAFGFNSEEETVYVSGVKVGQVKDDASVGYMGGIANFAWRFDIPYDIKLTPYSGFNLKLNLYGQDKVTTTAWTGNTAQTEKFTWNYFKKYKIDNEETSAASRVQFGWQIGVKGQWRQFLLGLEYELDFNSYMSHVSTSNFSVMVGYHF